MSDSDTERGDEQEPLLGSATEPLPFAFQKQGEVIEFSNVHYVMGDPLGFGAFGAVYACTDDWGNELAAKVLHPLSGRTLQQVREDWWNELQRLILLRHPQITFIYNAFEYKNLFYLIMERCTLPCMTSSTYQTRMVMFGCRMWRAIFCKV
jgi:serine/threonine protein kinase